MTLTSPVDAKNGNGHTAAPAITGAAGNPKVQMPGMLNQKMMDAVENKYGSSTDEDTSDSDWE